MGVVYAVLRNGLWDDPAEANTGSIANAFVQRLKALELSDQVAPYLTWRFCYLLCGLVFGVGQLVMGRLALQEAKTYEFLETQLPPSISMDSFKDLISWLDAEGQAVWALAATSFLLQCLGTLTAMPRYAVKWGSISRKCIWCAWLTTFLPPFILFLCFPMRLLVDWDRVTADVCVHSVRTTFTMPGGSFRQTFSMAEKFDLLNPEIQSLSTDPDKWCLNQGVEWHDSFFNTTVACIWNTEDWCKDKVCTKSGTQLNTCLQDCMGYVLPQASVAQKQGIMNSFRGCVSNLKEFTLGPPPPMPTKTGTLTSDDVIQIYSRLSYTQRQAIVEGSLFVHEASLHAEVAVGMLVSLVAAKYLGFASLALLGGLSEALVNLKAVFPASPQGGWLLILTTSQVVPVYSLALAVLQQLIGDSLLAVACVLMILLLSLGILTGYRILKLQHSDRQKLYKNIWLEYGLRALFGSATVALLFVWSSQKGFHDELIQHLKQNILTPQVMIAGIFEYYSKKIMNAVASTDMLLVVFVRSEAWIGALPPNEKSAHSSCIMDYQSLLMREGTTPVVEPDWVSSEIESIGNKSNA